MAKIVKMEVLVRKTTDTAVYVNVEVPDDFDEQNSKMMRELEKNAGNMAEEFIENDLNEDNFVEGEQIGITAAYCEEQHTEYSSAEIYE